MPDHLLHGYARFRDEYFSREWELIEGLAKGQAPSALFVGCSDSRVVPEIITSSAPGDLFVLRNVANQVPPPGSFEVSAGAAVEFAVQSLRVRHAIVCGHGGCGGVQAALLGDDAPLFLGKPALRTWVQGVKPAAQRARDLKLGGEATLDRAVKENVLLQLDNLIGFPCVQAALDAGELALHGWVYDVRTARLSVYDPDADAFVAVEDAPK